MLILSVTPRLPWRDPEDEEAKPAEASEEKSSKADVSKSELKKLEKLFAKKMDTKKAASKMVEFARENGLGTYFHVLCDAFLL